jgi:hypothetical protein
MFISNYEKHQLNMRIASLEIVVSRLEAQIEKLKPKLKPPIFRTDEAPWGYKKDGTPRKRPGRPIYNVPEIKNEQPLSV